MISGYSIVTATTPTRIVDCGGWTDTWFAKRGAVFHLAIEPRVHVRIEPRTRQGTAPTVTLEAVNFGHRETFVVGRRPWGAHRLIEAAIESVGVPDGLDLSVTVQSDMPPGASTGTSGAVCVALVGALRRLAGLPGRPLDVARAAHAVETDRLGQQSGVQDQLAAACGGCNFIEIVDYPQVRVTTLHPSAGWMAELNTRLVLVYLGRSHSSSAVHESVIRDVGAGAAHPALDRLRVAAVAARDAVLAEDVAALGAAMIANTEGQRQLHPALIGEDAARVIAVAQAAGALGWKVNGAGGEGGTVAVLTADGAASRAALEQGVRRASSTYRLIPVRLAPDGLTVTDG